MGLLCSRKDLCAALTFVDPQDTLNCFFCSRWWEDTVWSESDSNSHSLIFIKQHNLLRHLVVSIYISSGMFWQRVECLSSLHSKLEQINYICFFLVVSCSLLYFKSSQGFKAFFKTCPLEKNDCFCLPCLWRSVYCQVYNIMNEKNYEKWNVFTFTSFVLCSLFPVQVTTSPKTNRQLTCDVCPQ